MNVLEVKPVGWQRLSLTPIYSHEYIGSQVSVETPLPSTILGALGYLLGVKPGPQGVGQDPLLGLGVLSKELGEKCRAGNQPILLGPIIKVVKDREMYAVALYRKKGGILVELGGLEGLAKSLIGGGWESTIKGGSEMGVIGYLRVEKQLGITLHRGYKTPWATYRRNFIHYVDDKGRPLNYSYLYLTPCSGLAGAEIERLGGEGRLAYFTIRGVDGEFKELSGRLKSPDKASPGYYITLSPWPLLCSSDEPYIDPGQTPSLSRVKDILGIPHPQGSRVYVTRLGLGFSEVASKRRPLILALPPGTLVRISEGGPGFTDLDLALFKAGYASLLELNIR